MKLVIEGELLKYEGGNIFITRILQMKYNKEFPIIFVTYQAYSLNMQIRIVNDIIASKSFGFFFIIIILLLFLNLILLFFKFII